MGKTLTNESLVHEEIIKRYVIRGTSTFIRFVILCSCLLPEEIKIKIKETIFSGSILWLVSHIKRRTLAVNTMKTIFNPEKNEVIGD